MWANSANKFFDALASGTPVAINYGGWQADLLEETSAGIVLPPNDPGEAAKRLGVFIKDESELAKAGRRLFDPVLDSPLPLVRHCEHFGLSGSAA